MRQSRLPYFLFISLLAIFGFNFLGFRYDWYHVFWWYDIPMHVAGGMWVAAALLYFTRKYAWVARILPPKFLYIVGGVIAVGIGWEIFEYSMDVFVFKKYTFSTVPLFILIDSLYDLANDLAGPVLVLGFARGLPFMHKKRPDGLV